MAMTLIDKLVSVNEAGSFQAAQRSAQSAKEIKDLITQSLADVHGGGRTVKDASATIDDVVQGVLRGATLMGDISSGTREQSLGLQLVNRTLAAGEREEMTVIEMPAPQRPRNRPAPVYSAGMSTSGYMAGLV